MRQQALAAGTLDKLDGLDGLTAKQQLFVSYCFAGLNDADAYRAAYNCVNMSAAAVGTEANRVRHHPAITLKLRELQDKRDNQSTLASSLTREWIQQRIMQLADHADKDSVKLASLIALGKVVGIDLFRETTRVERIERTADEIDLELSERLKSLHSTIEGEARLVPATQQPARDRRRKPGPTT